MKRVFIGVLIAIAMSFAAKEYIGRKARSNEQNAEYKFLYYPRLNIYYDVAKNQYIYPIEDGGRRTWKTITSPDATSMNILGESVAIYSNNQKVWADNEEHIRLYNKADDDNKELTAKKQKDNLKARAKFDAIVAGVTYDSTEANTNEAVVKEEKENGDKNVTTDKADTEVTTEEEPNKETEPTEDKPLKDEETSDIKNEINL